MAIINILDMLLQKPDIFTTAPIDPRINIELLTNTIIAQSPDLLPLYTDTTVFKIMSDAFFKRNEYAIKGLLDTMEAEYSPLENYNIIEEDTGKNDYTAGTSVHTVGTNNTGSTNMRSAFDSADYQPNEKTDTEGNDDSTATKSGTDIYSHANKVTRKGNIGTKTAQEMIEAERRVRDFDIYHWIAIRYENAMFVQ